LPARHVIHTVGPVFRDGRHGEAELLASCYQKSLALAAAHDVRSIAFPAISCGAYGYPLEEAVEIAVRECLQGLRRYMQIERLVFACFDEPMLAFYERALDSRVRGNEDGA
jgi:O-acetyl-ADP-ribose deacetylase (regulator of RNase III)